MKEIDCDHEYPEREVGDLLGSPIFDSPIHRARNLKPCVPTNQEDCFCSDFEPLPRCCPHPTSKKTKRSIEVSISPCLTNIKPKMPTRSSSCDVITESGFNNYYNNNIPVFNNNHPETEISNTQTGRFKISICHSNSPSDFVKLSQMCTKNSKFSCAVEVAPPNLEEEFHRSNTVIPNPHNSCIQCDDLIRF